MQPVEPHAHRRALAPRSTRARLVGLGLASLAAALVIVVVPTSGSWVENATTSDVWIKPEVGTAPLLVAAGYRLDGELDGVAAPALRRNAVFKICDRCSATVRGASIETSCASIAGAVCQRLKGGWKDEAWVPYHEDFRPLLDRSR